MKMLMLLMIMVIAMCDPDAVLSQSPYPGDLVAEHRESKSAEPFLDKIASLFSGDTKKVPQKKIGRPLPAGPIYRPRPPPKHQQHQLQQPSVHRPVAVPPPQSFQKKPFYPPKPKNKRHQTSSSNGAPISLPAPSRSSQNPGDPWKIAQPANMAQIQDLQVQCEKDLMRVRVVFDRPFYGMVFSKGFYSNVNCVHVPAGLGQTQATFDIAMGQCGMSTGGNSDSYGTPTPQGSYIENTVIVQYDPLLQEVWDQARKMRCTWYDFYEKAVTFKPYQVDMLDPVTANFLGDNLRCWMQIQVGKGPYASEVSGIVKIGQTMTMVLGVKDDENKFDMMVRNCVAHDGQRSPIQLVDEKGCIVREKIMSPFKKLKNFDSTANVLSFAYFQAFKFPDSMNVHFQCVVQVCRTACPEPQCGGGLSPPAVDSYGAPVAAPISNPDSYGAPVAPPRNTNINPRNPAGPSTQYQSGSDRRVSIVRPEAGPKTINIPLNNQLDSLTVPQPGYTNFNKRLGLADTESLGGRPRSLDFGEGEEVPTGKKKVEETPEGETNGLDGEEKEASRRKRSLTDANGNRILNVSLRRVKREASLGEEDEEDVDQADIETAKIIRVVAPTDVQFKLTDDDKEEVVINLSELSPEALCIDTAAFVGVTITFIMLLIIAAITIVFLWLRIQAIDRKNLL